MQFDLPKEATSIIKVIGVGGGGSNAVNYMYRQGIEGVNFVVCNTDAQVLETSPVPNKIQLGPTLTEGRGAGTNPEIGKKAMEESIDQLRELLEVNTKMVFITAGMGGGTGTGGAPVLAKLCREMGILTVGIVTVPFTLEGPKRKNHAHEGVQRMRENVDSLIVISNDKLKDMYADMKMSQAFAKADDILTTAAKGIAEIITIAGYINVDFEDVKTVMKDSGVALMGFGSAEGEYRAMKAIESALSSQLLNDNDISGARHILLNVTSGLNEVSMDEMNEILEYLQNQAGEETDLIFGTCIDETLDDQLNVTIIATGFEMDQLQKKIVRDKGKVIVHTLGGDGKENIQEPRQQQPLASPTYTKPLAQEPVSKINAHAEDSLDLFGNRQIAEDVAPETSEEPLSSAHDQESDDVIRYDLELDPVDTVAEDSPYIGFEDEEDDMPIAQGPEEEDGFHFVLYNKEEEEKKQPVQEETAPMSRQQPEASQNRFEKLRRFNFMRKDAYIQELESTPAYARRGTNLEDTPASDDAPLSRTTLNGDSNDIQLRSDNRFLHDSVD